MVEYDEELKTWYLVHEGNLFYLDATTQSEAYEEANEILNDIA